MNPLVSIITPSYNQVAYLENAIRSVLLQDYSPIEYFVMDGGSTDGSFEVIQRFSGQLDGWVSEQDSGQAEAINKGFLRAQGEIVAWLNSDDFYLPEAVKQAVAFFQEDSDLGLVFGDALTIDACGQPLKRLAFGKWGLEQLVCFRIICQPAVFIRRSALQKAGMLDPSYHFMLDHQLWIRIARVAKVRYAGSRSDGQPNSISPWAAARQHPAAKNVSQSAGFSLETMRILDWMETQPDLREITHTDRRNVLAGAYRLNARYLLDGGSFGDALKSYVRAVQAKPTYALKHWHRMIYAGLAQLGFKNILDNLRAPFQSRSRKKIVHELLSSDLNRSGQLENWPGLRFPGEGSQISTANDAH